MNNRLENKHKLIKQSVREDVEQLITGLAGRKQVKRVRMGEGWVDGGGVWG